MQPPEVSIIVPVYNTERFIGAAIESVLQQTFSDFELIIVDDCSTDGTFLLCQQYATRDQRIKLFRNKQNLGMMPNWNVALEFIKKDCKYWAKLDADDIWSPDMIQTCYRILEANSEVGLVCGKFVHIDVDGEVLPKTEWQIPEFARDKAISFIPFVKSGAKGMFSHNIAQQGVGLIRKEFLDRYGKYLEIPAGDTEFYFRVGAHYKIYSKDKLLHYHRIWSDSFIRSTVLSTFGSFEINLNEAKGEVAKYYYKSGIISIQEYWKFMADIRYDLNKMLIVAYRTQGKYDSMASLLFRQIWQKPITTILFYLNRFVKRTMGKG